MDTDLKKIQQLRKEIKEHNHYYYVLGEAVITDAEYDVKLKELVKLEQANPDCFDAESPTQKVGAVSAFGKVKHRVKMLSLDNTYSAEEVEKFFDPGTVLTVEPKFDGLSLALHYLDGKLVQAVTRGDGTTGDDVTANARMIEDIPGQINHPRELEVRGEVYMPISVFNRLNAEAEKTGDDILANPRNAAAGAMKLKNSKESGKRGLRFVAYSVARGSMPESVVTQLDMLSFLDLLGFKSPGQVPAVGGYAKMSVFRATKCPEIKRVLEMIEADRKQYDVQTDGVVFKVSSLKEQAELGTGTRAPKWATAFKFPPERKVTRLKFITISVGRHGTLTPVAELEPVQLGGTTVKRASLMNENEIARVGGCSPGDYVWVEKSAEIIPRVCGVKQTSQDTRWVMPKTCPCCGTIAVRDEGMVAWYCPNEECEDQVKQRLLHSLGKSALDLDGSGDAMIELLVKCGVRKLSDVFLMQQFTTKDGPVNMGSAAMGKFVSERERVKQAPLWRKMYALNIEGFGRTACQDLTLKFPSMEGFVAALETKAGYTEVEKLVGEVNTRSLVKWLCKNVDEVERLESAGFKFQDDTSRSGPLVGKSFVITGTMLSGKRDEVAAWIEEAGGVMKGSVSKKVDYLVVGEEGGANKAAAAKKLGTTCISESELFTLMGREMPVNIGV